MDDRSVYTDRDCFDAMRRKALDMAKAAVSQLSAEKSSDGMMAPHVAADRIVMLRKIARQINALADFVESVTI